METATGATAIGDVGPSALSVFSTTMHSGRGPAIPCMNKACLLLSVCLLLPLRVVAQETVTLVAAEALPRATFSELAAVPLLNAPRTIVQRTVPRFRFPSAQSEPLAPVVDATPSLPPPAITRSFTSGAEKGWAPADASGAVGRAHIVSALNSGIYVHDRSGALLSSVSLAQFWFSSVPNGSYYDPRVAYDRDYDRWIVISVFDERALMLAYSETGDPTGAWRRFTIQQDGADYSGLALTKDTVVFSSCYGWSDNIGTDIYAIQKEALYAATNTISVQKTELLGRIGVAPVRSDDSTIEYIVDAFNTQAEYRRLDANGQPFQTITSGLPWYSTERWVPQLSGPEFWTGWGQIDAAAERDGTIYAVMTRSHATEDRMAIVWCKFTVANPKSEWGVIEDSTGTQWYAYPSLAVSKSGAMLIGFGIFSESAYASAGYVYRDAFGRTSGIGVIRTGDTPYSLDRWGDYSSTDVDPLDASTFWTLQSYCSGKTWATAWAMIGTSPSTKRRAVRN
jgi:hypothetical protein